VPAYLDALPIDPFSGEPMRYRATGTEYVVYSVGINGKDEGGEQAEAAPWRPGPNGSDLRSSGDVGLRITALTGIARSQ
jgi:hypothetical protein